jgi:hypothetical protein
MWRRYRRPCVRRVADWTVIWWHGKSVGESRKIFREVPALSLECSLFASVGNVRYSGVGQAAVEAIKADAREGVAHVKGVRQMSLPTR